MKLPTINARDASSSGHESSGEITGHSKSMYPGKSRFIARDPNFSRRVTRGGGATDEEETREKGWRRRKKGRKKEKKREAVTFSPLYYPPYNLPSLFVQVGRPLPRNTADATHTPSFLDISVAHPPARLCA